jgi:hypothetical protein
MTQQGECDGLDLGANAVAGEYVGELSTYTGQTSAQQGLVLRFELTLQLKAALDPK